MENSNYAGFWLRFVAIIIDVIIISFMQFVVVMPILAMLGFGFASTQGFDFNNLSEEETVGMVGAFVAAIGGITIISFAIQTLYFSLMESSKYQATVGKMALGLKVTDINGDKLDFGKALLRQICKIISQMVFMFGYIMAGFTEKKQALHDMIASALVVRK